MRFIGEKVAAVAAETEEAAEQALDLIEVEYDELEPLFDPMEAAKPDAPKSELAEGGGTDNPEFAVVDPKTKQPVENGARNIWVSETGLSTALNVSYMASALSLFQPRGRDRTDPGRHRLPGAGDRRASRDASRAPPCSVSAS